jgi:hypothetical protein
MTDALPETSTTGQDRYSCLDYTAFYAGDELKLFETWATGARQVLPAISEQLLKACDRFRTPEEHARVICQEPPFQEVPVEAVRDLVAGLVAVGLLVPYADLVPRLGQRTGPHQAPTISTVGILTCNRPDALRRVVSTTAENAATHGRQVQFVIVDDSDAEQQGANLAVLHNLIERSGLNVWYAGPTEKAAFARDLASHCDVPLSTVNVALTRPEGWTAAPGANRNALLLHTVGEALLSLDDDMVCKLARLPAGDDGLGLTSLADPMQFWHYPSREATLLANPFVEDDFLALHESLLGRNVGRLAAERAADQPFDLDAIGSTFLRRLEPDGGQVTLTMAGILGDTGQAGALSFYLSEGPSRDRLLRAEGGFRAAMASRQVARGVLRRTVSEGGFCMGGNLGLDNRGLLPPFQTAGRSEDDGFAALVRRTVPGSFVGYLPRTIMHDPVVARRASTDNFDDAASELGVSEAMQRLLDGHPEPPSRSTTRRRQQSIGQYLVELAAVTPIEIEEHLHDILLGRCAADAALVEKARRRQAHLPEPEPWLPDLEQYQEVLRANMERSQPVTIVERPNDTPEAARAAFQAYLREFGHLLCAWPDLVEGARELRQRGRRLARQLTSR